MYASILTPCLWYRESLSSPAVLALKRLYAALGAGRVAGDTTAGADTDLALFSLSETHGNYRNYTGNPHFACDSGSFPTDCL